MTIDLREVTEWFESEQPWKDGIFEGKVVFVTGGAGTICSAQTAAMVLLGANASIVGRSREKTQSVAQQLQSLREGCKVVACHGTDVRQLSDLNKAVEKTVKELGKIDYVIAGAAGNFLADFNHLSSNAFKTVVDIDLLGSFNTVKACFKELRKNKGSVIFVSATLHYYGVPFQIHVGAAKAGVDALCNALAVELGPIGIRCNAIAPGAIGDTEGFARLVPNKASFEKSIPMQKLGSVIDIANATVYLFSPAASYVTGTVQVVDGGLWQMGNQSTMHLYPQELKKRLLSDSKL